MSYGGNRVLKKGSRFQQAFDSTAYLSLGTVSMGSLGQPPSPTRHMDLLSSSSHPPINYFSPPPPPPCGAPPPPSGGAPPPPPSCTPQYLVNNVRSLAPSQKNRVPPPPPIDNLFETVVLDGLDPSKLSKQNGARNSIVPSSALSQLVALQSAEGFWTLDQSLASLIGCTLVELKSTCPAGCTEVMWATLLALAFLEKQFTSHHDEWELVAMKAEFWLQSQPLPSTVDSLKQIASQNLK